jgi:two-component system chemotaxis response regulator CheB
MLFHSVASVYGSASIGLLLTGMGEDGAAGLLAMSAKGARTVAQSEESAVVFGMPKAAVNCGAAHFVLSLPDIATYVRSLARAGSKGRA